MEARDASKLCSELVPPAGAEEPATVPLDRGIGPSERCKRIPWVLCAGWLA